MEFDQNPEGVLTPLPAKNIDTGLGLNRLASILQDQPSVFETDQFAPLIALGEELSGRRYDSDEPTAKALRVLADHSRSISFLLADGIVPSNEDRGYVLRRVIRRAIRHGRGLGLDSGFLLPYADRVTELMGSEYPELREQRELIAKWLTSEEESFGHTLEQGLKRLEELIERAHDSDAEGVSAADAFQLHDTFGFPFDLTLEIVSEHGLGVDEAGFETLMNEQRDRARADTGRTRGGEGLRDRALEFAGGADFQTEFVGYETTDADTTIGAVTEDDGRLLVKLVESPFYATGGGQVADSGTIECAGGDCLATVSDVVRLGDDQVLALAPEHGRFEPGEQVHAQVDRARAPRDRVQSHGHPPAPRGVAQAARQPCAPGRLLRRPRQAAVRLHSRRGAQRRRRGGRAGGRQSLDSREPAGAGDLDHARRGQGARRDGAVRREVR